MSRLKTPEYTRKAVARYQAKFDRVNINLNKGLKDQIKAATGESLNACVVRLLLEELERLGCPYVEPSEDQQGEEDQGE